MLRWCQISQVRRWRSSFAHDWKHLGVKTSVGEGELEVGSTGMNDFWDKDPMYPLVI